MPSRPTGGVEWVRAVFFGTGDIKEWSNDFWFSVNSGTIDFTTLDFQNSAKAIYDHLMTHWPAAVTTGITIRGCYVEFNNGAGTIGTDYYSSTSGTGISSTLPEDVAVVVQKITTDPHRYARGRWYFTGAGTDDIDGSYLNSSGVTDWTAFAATLKTTITLVGGGIGATLSPAHFSPQTGLLYPIVNTPVVSLLGTRRRRRGPF